MTSKVADVIPTGTPPEARSRVPNVYPRPPLETVTDSTVESLLITTVAVPPLPSPRIGTPVYVIFGAPRPTPRFLIVIILI